MEQARFEDVNIDKLLIEGKALSADIAGALTAARLQRGMDGAPTIELEVLDPQKKLISSQTTKDGQTIGFFSERKTAQIDGKEFEFTRNEKQGTTYIYTFEALAAAEMRRHKDRTSVAGGSMTRVDFARKLLNEPNSAWIQLHVHPAVKLEVAKVQLARGRVLSEASSESTINPNYFGSGSAASGGMLTGVEVARICRSAGWTGEDLVIAVAVAKQESTWKPLNTNGQYKGLFQIGELHKDLMKMGDWRDPAINARMAYTLWKRTGWSRSWEAYSSGDYRKYMGEARAAVAGMGSSTVDTSGAGTAAQRNALAKEEALGGAEDTWECIKRIFSEVNWRAYVDWDGQNRGAVFVGPDSAFLSNPIELNLTEGSEGVDTIDWVFDTGESSASMTIECKAHRWQLPPGTAVNVPETGLPNPWLVRSAQRDLSSVDCVIELTKPEPALPEPEAPDPESDGGIDVDYFKQLLGISEPSSSGAQMSENVDTGGIKAWKWPTLQRTINSPFGGSRNHKGIDINAAVGDGVYASRGGTVTRADGTWNPGGYGNVVIIDHPGGFQTYYGHLSKIVVTRGVSVKQGDLIGLSGGAKGAPGAGSSTGPHVHFEIRTNGTPTDPLRYLNLSPASGGRVTF